MRKLNISTTDKQGFYRVRDISGMTYFKTDAPKNTMIVHLKGGQDMTFNPITQEEFERISKKCAEEEN